MSRRCIALFALLAPAIGCAIAGTVPEARVRRGTHAPPHRVLVLSATGSSPSAESLVASLAAIDASVRMDLELHGVVVVDERAMNAALRELGETTQTLGERTVEARGRSFAESPLEMQEDVLTSLEIDGRLVSRLDFGPPRRGVTGEQAVTVDLELRTRDGGLVVASHCVADWGAHADFSTAAARATRCATHGLMLGLERGS